MRHANIAASLRFIPSVWLAVVTVSPAAAQKVVDNTTLTTETPGVVIRESLDDAWWTGPIYAATPATLPQGHILIEPYLYDSISYGHFDDNWSKSSSNHADAYRSFSFLMYGVTDTFMVGLLPRFGYNDISGSPASGASVGDTTVRLQYRLARFYEGGITPTVSLVLDETFPSGKYDELGASPGSGLGEGAYTTTVSLYSQYFFWPWSERILRARLNLSYSFPDASVRLKDASVYGTESGFRGDARPGTSFEADLAFEYSLTQRWVPAIDVIYEHDGSTLVRGNVSGSGDLGAITTNVYERSSAGESFTVAPAIEYNWNGHVGVIVGVAFTAAGRNTTAAVTPVIGVNCVY